jgi:hypothetical protein
MGYIPYHEGAGIDHYISSAGGYAPGAVPDETRVIKAQTKQWMKPEDTSVEPGDEIYIPKEGDYPSGYTLSVIGAIAGITSGLVFVAVQIFDRTK